MRAERYLSLTASARRFSVAADDGGRPSLGELGILECLCAWGWPSVRLRDLALAQGLSSPTVSYRVFRLMGMGYLHRAGLACDPDVVVYVPTKRAKLVSIVLATRSVAADERRAGIAGHARLRELAAECAAACSAMLSLDEACLVALVGLGAPAVSADVERVSGLAHSQVARSIKSLCSSGDLVREKFESGDRRRFRYFVSAAGKSRFHDVEAALSPVSGRDFESLGLRLGLTVPVEEMGV